MSWEPPGHNGGSKVTYYTLEVAQDAPCACGGCPPPLPASAAAAGRSQQQQRQHEQHEQHQGPCEAALDGNSVQMNLSGDVTTAEIRDLQPGSAYFFRVAANNAQV